MPKIRVLIIDDAVVIRRMVSEVLSRDPALEVVGTAANGRIGLQKIPQVNPDVVTLDVEMPEMDGLATLRELRKTYPKLPVIMFSTLTEKGAVTTLEALAAGASDYVAKPANIGGVAEGIERLEKELVPKIKTLCAGHLAGPAGNVTALRTSSFSTEIRARRGPIELVCIGTSTGGPNALAEVFRNFPSDFPVPFAIVQHMPPLFTAFLAERLSAGSSLKFREGIEGERLMPGYGYVAPGGKHMEVVRRGLHGLLHLHDGPPENSCRPAADVLFRSAAAAYGAGVLGVVLTGMGQDGLRGCEQIRERCGRIFAQDAASSVVWGMPGAVVTAGLAEKILPLNQVSQEIVRCVQQSRLGNAA